MGSILWRVLVTPERADCLVWEKNAPRLTCQKKDLRAERDNRKWGRGFHHALWVRWVS